MKPGAWTGYWFSAGSPTALAVCRVLFFGGVLLYYLPRSLSLWSEVSPAFWDPVWLFGGRLRLPGLSATPPVLSEEVVDLLQRAWEVALFFSCFGFLTRVSTVLSFVLAVYLMGLTANFGHSGHQYQLPVIVMGVMAAARAGDRLSIDDWLRRKRTGGSVALAPAGEYTWPIKAVWLAMAFVFVAAGIAKLRHSGLAWFTTDTLANYLVVNNYLGNTSVDPLTDWGLTLAQYPTLCRVLAASVLAVELSFPLVLVSATVRSVLVPISFCMMIGWRVFLGPPFDLFMLCYVFWVPWQRILQHIARRRGAVRQVSATPPRAVAP